MLPVTYQFSVAPNYSKTASEVTLSSEDYFKIMKLAEDQLNGRQLSNQPRPTSPPPAGAQYVFLDKLVVNHTQQTVHVGMKQKPAGDADPETQMKVPKDHKSASGIEATANGDGTFNLTLADGSTYCGQLKNVRHGVGVHKRVDGSVYQGEWQYDKACGKGKLVLANGDVYEGQFKDGLFEGFGVYTTADKRNRYEGSWKDGQKHGQGKEASKDQSMEYEGCFFEGVKHGKGKWTGYNGDMYEGYFLHNMESGIGRFEWKDGRRYEGNLKDGKIHGIGTYTWPDGRKYIGNYNQEIKEGYGEFYWPDGKVFKGIWKSGKQQGQGTFFSDGRTRTGEWNEGKVLRWLD